jgi:plasmid maintenance system antidote protein VapI
LWITTRSRYGTHRNSPREHFAEELDALNTSAAELARRLNVPTNRVTELLNGQRAITGQKSGESID